MAGVLSPYRLAEILDLTADVFLKSFYDILRSGRVEFNYFFRRRVRQIYNNHVLVGCGSVIFLSGFGETK